MRKTRFLLLFLLLFLLGTLFSCASSTGEADCLVTFLSADGEIIETRTVGANTRITPPDAPIESCLSFLGWSASEGAALYDFSVPITRDMTLRASYSVDYVTWTNRLTEEMLGANVTVEARFIGLGEQTRSVASGALIALENDTYFLLTNAHAVKKDGFSHAEYTVTDCYGNRYTARLNSCDKTYDLAVLFFAKDGEVDLPIFSLAVENAEEGSAVAAIGQPNGVKNALTYGEVSSYRQLPQKEGESVALSFDVLLHTAPTEHGSSGGALINTDLRLVGINFAVLSDEDGDFCYTASIPIEKVAEYLSTHPFYS